MNDGEPGALKEWRAALGKDRLHHAWLLAGPPCSGKAAFAAQAAADLVRVPLAEAGRHPDITRLSREPKDAAEARKAEEGKPFESKRSITVMQIREMQQRFATRPTMGEKRAIIVDPADDLEPSASNALLKSLEEPPDGTVFLLVSHHPGKLLATIRSRCRVLRFADARSQRAGMPAARDVADAVDQLLGGKGDAALLGRSLDADATAAGRSRAQLVCDVALERLSALAESSTSRRFQGLDRSYAELRRLQGELTTYNYDGDLMAVRLATLLKGVAAPID